MGTRSREEQLLRDCRGIGCCWLDGEPKEVLALWESGDLRRSSDYPFVYTTVVPPVEPDDD